ncbi:BadF/BadG/BcrA/BcrD ATPase family protein [Massilia terrae]|uniref:ATPase n=1 Tax=Massilia terrae TaxID=1811224 RepID=A0ABT2CZ12_9BURK|nr:BadF/BadG/BcrA/BcrD ATPase family protein [Massilia terrae]MCS0659216.1 ATPase [Massilia terrae]
MIEFLLGVDGGGTGTRVRLARVGGTELAQAASGPSGLSLGIDKAWAAVNDAAAKAFAAIGIDAIPFARTAVGLGMAGVHNKEWAAQFEAANPGYAALALNNDGVTTLIGAHAGEPGVIVAIGTGSVGESLLADGSTREVSGWGFPAGDEASGAWMGLRAVGHIEQVLDGRKPRSAFADAVIDACGGNRDAVQSWLGKATQTTYAGLARIVIAHGESDPVARTILEDAGREVAVMAAALDPSGALPVALCGGLGEPLRRHLPQELLARVTAPRGDSAQGALRLIEQHLKKAFQ